MNSFIRTVRCSCLYWSTRWNVFLKNFLNHVHQVLHKCKEPIQVKCICSNVYLFVYPTFFWFIFFLSFRILSIFNDLRFKKSTAFIYMIPTPDWPSCWSPFLLCFLDMFFLFSLWDDWSGWHADTICLQKETVVCACRFPRAEKRSH